MLLETRRECNEVLDGGYQVEELESFAADPATSILRDVAAVTYLFLWSEN